MLISSGKAEARTIENCGDHVERLVADCLDQPLYMLGDNPSLVTARYEKITQQNGLFIANGCILSLRAIYNHARNAARSLPPENPVTAIDLNSEKRQNTGLDLNELPALGRPAPRARQPHSPRIPLVPAALGKPARRLKHAKIKHIDFRSRILHIPKPKGGEIRAFDIPLSRTMIRCLVRIFAAGSRS